MNKFVVEFFGTFFLTFAIVFGHSFWSGLNSILLISISYAVLVILGASYSGAHYNPAITLAALIRGKLNGQNAFLYFVVQFFGAILGSTLGLVIISNLSDVSIPLATTNLEFFPSLWSELGGAFLLSFIMLQSRTIKTPLHKYTYGVLMGLCLGLLIYFLKEFSGGVFNPAVAIGVCSVKMALWEDIWLFLIPTIAGGALAALVYLIFNGSD